MSTPAEVIYAYEIYEQEEMAIEPAPIDRAWMEADNRFAYRCLPLSIANQCGWIIRNPVSFSACWNGGLRKHDLTISFTEDDPVPSPAAAMQNAVIDVTWDSCFAESSAVTYADRFGSWISSHFGNGIITFSIPYLFRTPPGVNLWVKGPSNWIKDGAQALEGIVESDWTSATFTMNWKMTAAGRIAQFERGEPICMIVPIPRGFVESLHGQIAPLTNNPELLGQYEQWNQRRADFLEGLRIGREDELQRKWEKDYFKGQTPAGEDFEQHQTRLEIKPFVRV